MKRESKKIGVVVGVDGDIAQVGTYSMSNDSQFLWNGSILNGPKVGAYLTINQDNIKIIATVSSEKIIDQQNTVKSTEFDNRYHKDSINRVITLKTKGVIENQQFQITSQYVPMVGNEVTITSQDELNIIFEIEPNEKSIYVGKSIFEGQPINLSINKFFASHIGIFGNTGSGKSNTLHKLYFQLFNSEYYPEGIRGKSQFFVIDFNGEYTGENTFGISNGDEKRIFEIETNRKNKESKNKFPIKDEYLFNADILSILFDARPATQVPFLRKAINVWNDSKFNGETFAKFVVGTIKKILTTGEDASSDAKDNWIQVAKKEILRVFDKKQGTTLNLSNLTYRDYEFFYKDGESEIKFIDYKSDLWNAALKYLKVNDVEHFIEIAFLKLSNLNYNTSSHSYYDNDMKANKEYINDKSGLSKKAFDYLNLKDITNFIEMTFNSSDEIDRLRMHLEFQKVHQSAWKSTNIEHINPLFNRIDSAFASLSKVVEVKTDISKEFKTMNIISLVRANQEITRLIPMLVSKMIFDEQRNIDRDKGLTVTKHLIIDEAHNILNAEYRNTGDDWQDYRLSVFEKIVKEGRKFGFYLTLASQRPADISSTILSQVHNYFIHRLVNEKDLHMLENTMPTLDKNSFRMIPSLGQGEAIITGTSMSVPIFAKIEKEKVIRPKSDDIKLTDLWEQKNTETGKEIE